MGNADMPRISIPLTGVSKDFVAQLTYSMAFVAEDALSHEIILADNRLVVRSLATSAGKIADVSLLGHSGKLDWHGDSPQMLAEGKFLAFDVDPEHTGQVNSTADLRPSRPAAMGLIRLCNFSARASPARRISVLSDSIFAQIFTLSSSSRQTRRSMAVTLNSSCSLGGCGVFPRMRSTNLEPSLNNISPKARHPSQAAICTGALNSMIQ